MKKALLIILGIVVVLLAAAAILPVIYKDEIRAKLQTEINKNVNANVAFSDFGLSLFRHFPHATASMENFSVVGKDEFQGDTLAAIQSLDVTVNLMSLISGDQIKVKEIDLDQPRILAKVLKNGKANWDIAIADSSATDADTSASEFSLGIDSWSIRNGYVVYDDQTLPMYTRLVGLNHTGSGDFTQDIFDMATQTDVKQFTFAYDSVAYLSDQTFNADMTLNMNLPEFKFTFKDNTVKVNDFAIGFNGFFAMPDTNMNLDITYKAQENTFKSLLSLVPGVYSESFKDLKADGNVAFDGYVKGTYNAVRLPAFGVNVQINNGTMQYASLPTAVRNVNVDMKVDNRDGILDNTVIDIKKLHADFGKNPVDGRILVKGLTNYDIDANVLAKLNLGELTQMFPIEGVTLKGLYNLNLKAKGVYSEAQKRMPAIDASMSLQNGYVKSKDFPAPLEQINFSSTVKNQSGQMADTKVWVKNFRMLLEGEPLQANAYVENFDDYTYDVQVKGTADLTKITKIYPLEGMKLAGKIKADIDAKGKMSDVEVERYDKLTNSGSMQVSNFTYESADVPQGVKITSAAMNFSPQAVNLTQFNGFLGKSDVAMKGSLSNYMGYLFRPNQTIHGNLSFESRQFDVNEWMTEDTTATPEDTSAMTVVEIPKNIDFTLVSTLGKVLYDNLTMNNMAGTIIVRDGAVRMDKLAFGALGGNFITSGTYDTKDVKNPKFDFDLNISQVAVKEAYKTFTTVQALMPLAQYISGDFSTDFKIGGGLGQDMMPLLNTLTGGGLIKLNDAIVQDAPILSSLSSFTKLNDLKTIKLKDVVLQAKVEDGRISYQPFDVVIADKYKMNIGGNSGIDGSLDYKVKMDVPARQLGATVNNALASLTGKPVANAETIKLDLGVGGTFKSPKIGLAGSSTSGTVKETVTAAVKEKVNAQVDKAKEEVEAKARAEADRLKAEAEAKAKAEQDRIKAEAEAKKKQLESEAKKKLEEEKKKLKDRLFGKPAPADTTKKQ